MFNVFSSKDIKGNQLEKGISKPGNIRITQFQQQKTARLDKNSPFELNQPTTPSAFGTLGARHANKATWALRRQSTRALSDLAALVDLAVCKSEAWLHFKTVVCNFLVPVVWFFKNYKRHPPSNVTKYLRLPWKNLKIISKLILVTYEAWLTMRCATEPTLQSHQILRLPKNVSHDSSSSHMIHHLQCAEQQYSPPRITNYCLTLCYHLTLLLIDSTLLFFSLRSRSYTESFSTKLP